MLFKELDLSQLVTRLSCSGSVSPNLYLSPYCMRVRKGDIVKNALQKEAREDGIVNFEKKKKNLSTKYMGILQDVQLNFNTPRGITSVMFRTHWGTFLLNFPVSFR
jgi:hypothetical protein